MTLGIDTGFFVGEGGGGVRALASSATSNALFVVKCIHFPSKCIDEKTGSEKMMLYITKS